MVAIFACDIQLQERKERPFIRCRLPRKSFRLWIMRASTYREDHSRVNSACDIAREVDHHFLIWVVGIFSKSGAEMIFVDL